MNSAIWRISHHFLHEAPLPLSLPLGKRMKQVPNRKQRDAEDGTRQIDIVPDAVLFSPVHKRKQVECLEDVRQDDDYQTSCTD